jgi:farnesyl-diphosphate farnesyltransferase
MPVDLKLLAGVSRSFYISLRFVPRAMRDPLGAAYLLARLTDTIADSGALSPKQRLAGLDLLREVIVEDKPEHDAVLWCNTQAISQTAPGERDLLQKAAAVIESFQSQQATDREDIRKVLEIILTGQRSDLIRFENEPRSVTCLTEEELDRYTYQVAGCVGEFWTALGFRHVHPFSRSGFPQMREWGIAFGKGLQLVNILRDFPEDLRHGRCYLPIPEPGKILESVTHSAVPPEVIPWFSRTEEGLRAGLRYADENCSFRLRFCCGVPAMLGIETLKRVRTNFGKPGIKVPRREFKRLMARALLHAALRNFSRRDGLT